MSPEPWMQELWRRCIHWGWAPRDPLFSAVCPVMVFCDGLHLPQGEALRRGGSYTYPGKVALMWAQPAFIQHRSIYLGLHHPQWTEPFSINQRLRKCPTDKLTGQSGGGSSLRFCLPGYVRLTTEANCHRQLSIMCNTEIDLSFRYVRGHMLYLYNIQI